MQGKSCTDCPNPWYDPDASSTLVTIENNTCLRYNSQGDCSSKADKVADYLTIFDYDADTDLTAVTSSPSITFYNMQTLDSPTKAEMAFSASLGMGRDKSEVGFVAKYTELLGITDGVTVETSASTSGEGSMLYLGSPYYPVTNITSDESPGSIVLNAIDVAE